MVRIWPKIFTTTKLYNWTWPKFWSYWCDNITFYLCTAPYSIYTIVHVIMWQTAGVRRQAQESSDTTACRYISFIFGPVQKIMFVVVVKLVMLTKFWSYSFAHVDLVMWVFLFLLIIILDLVNFMLQYKKLYSTNSNFFKFILPVNTQHWLVYFHLPK